MNAKSTGKPRMAIETDLPKLEKWLQEEAARTGERGFLHNWNLIEKGIEEGHLHVLEVRGAPVAFLLGTDIMEVDPKHRGRGYGRALAGYIFETYCQDRAVLTIECAPTASLSFWQKLGFTQLDTRETYPSTVYAFKTFEQGQALGQRKKVPYSISFYNESRQ